ncbi:MAG: Ni/Fe hydrogenase subunit alpha [Candidatus Desulfofervidaceae bacterium]|nr:Ni/Fe hydrogenase subunit alpha [Candidatus Desulfofervidaceae bacterium]
MGKTLTIQPVTRIEGHAKVLIELDDNGNVADAKMAIVALRGFEQFCIGRAADEMPRIVNRICGICPWSHHLASNKAVDKVYGVTPPPAGEKLRRLMQHLSWIPDKILHFYFLAAPDFIMGPDADPSVRNVLGVLKSNPDLGMKVVKMRQLGSMLIENFAGKVIHPAAGVPGGFSKPMTEAEREELLKGAEELLEFAKFSIDLAKKDIFPKYMDLIENVGVIKTGFIGTVSEDGSWEIYDGKLRMMKADGSYEDFSYEQYTDYIAEHVEPWAYVKFPYAKRWGEFALEFDNPTIYRSNCLARINVCDKMPTPLAQAELEEFREKFGRPCQYTILYNYARLIELLCNAESAVALLKDPEITDRNVRTKVEPQAGRGVGCVESLQGTLIHDYEADQNGLITRVNLIVGSTHNAAPMNLSVKQAAQALIQGGNYDQGLLNKIEIVIRAYNP